MLHLQVKAINFVFIILFCFWVTEVRAERCQGIDLEDSVLGKAPIVLGKQQLAKNKSYQNGLVEALEAYFLKIIPERDWNQKFYLASLHFFRNPKEWILCPTVVSQDCTKEFCETKIDYNLNIKKIKYKLIDLDIEIHKESLNKKIVYFVTDDSVFTEEFVEKIKDQLSERFPNHLYQSFSLQEKEEFSCNEAYAKQDSLLEDIFILLKTKKAKRAWPYFLSSTAYYYFNVDVCESPRVNPLYSYDEPWLITKEEWGLYSSKQKQEFVRNWELFFSKRQQELYEQFKDKKYTKRLEYTVKVYQDPNQQVKRLLFAIRRLPFVSFAGLSRTSENEVNVFSIKVLLKEPITFRFFIRRLFSEARSKELELKFEKTSDGVIILLLP